MKLIANFSMLGRHPTGLGRYAMNFFDVVGQFDTTVISSGPGCNGASRIINSPDDITIGAGKFSSLKRNFWLNNLRLDDEGIIYSPTHHGMPHAENQIITIHDLICLKFPKQHYLQYIFFKYYLPKLMDRCKAIFTVSEATRQDIYKTYNYPIERIFVVPNAVGDPDFRPGQVDTKNPYLLMVGARYSHKNVDEVLRMAHLWKEDYVLRITSCGGSYRAHLEREIVRLGLTEHVEFFDYVSKDKLIKLYQECTALVYPSKWEGFGIPPLEALACGRPVIASDIPAHKEVLGEAAIWIHNGDEDSWRDALFSIKNSGFISEKLGIGGTRLAIYTQEMVVSALKDSLLQACPLLCPREAEQ